MVRKMKVRASVRMDRIDVTSFEERARGITTRIPGGCWRVTMPDGRERTFTEWSAAISYADGAMRWDPFR